MPSGSDDAAPVTVQVNAVQEAEAAAVGATFAGPGPEKSTTQ